MQALAQAANSQMDANGRFLQAGWLPQLAAIASHAIPNYKVAPCHVTSYPAARPRCGGAHQSRPIYANTGLVLCFCLSSIVGHQNVLVL